MRQRCLLLWFGLLILTACSSAVESAAPMVTTTPSQPVVTETKALPAPFSSGNQIVWQDLQVTMKQVEISGDFVTEYGSTRLPSAGENFMWAHVQLKNIGKNNVDLPLPENFSALYAASEFKPTYGHRMGYVDYLSLNPIIFPNQNVDAWLRFDIPATAGLQDLRFVFLPESSGVGASFSSPNYPYSEDHPTYVWKCGQ